MVAHRIDDRFDLGHQLRIQTGFECIEVFVVDLRATRQAHQRARRVSVVETKTQGERGNRDPTSFAPFDDLSAGVFCRGVGRVPVGCALLAQYAHVQRSSIDEADAVFTRKGRESLVEVPDHEVVAGVGKDVIDRSNRGYLSQHVELQATDADVARLAALLHAPGSGDRLFDDLTPVAELNVVDLVEVDVVGAKTPQGFIDAAFDPFG